MLIEKMTRFEQVPPLLPHPTFSTEI